MSGVIWLDYLDARRRLVHAWHAEGLEAFDISLRLEVEPERIATILTQPVDPPLPGSSRSLVEALRRRVLDLERELHRTAPPPPPAERPPLQSEWRELAPEPDPDARR